MLSILALMPALNFLALRNMASETTPGADQAKVVICIDMGFEAEVLRVVLLAGVHFRVTCCVLVRDRWGCGSQGGVHGRVRQRK